MMTAPQRTSAGDGDRARSEMRVLVLAPTRRDGEVTRGLLEESGLATVVCASVRDVATELGRGAGCVVLTDDAVEWGDVGPLREALAAQPEWSELPVVVLARGTGSSGEGARVLGMVHGVTVLERPVLMRTLVSTVRAAVRARERQYVVRRQLEQIRAAAEDREQLLAAEREARALAERANQAKDQFLAVLSHELRTPLTPVLATAQMMSADASLPEEVRESFGMIRRNVELEARLIDDLLDLTRVTRGKLELQPVPVDVHAKVAGVITIVESDVRAKRLELLTDLSARRHYVNADPARLQQVLWNLLKNAVKFTPEGGRITVRSWDEPGGRIRVSVTDTGVGIPADVLPRLFNAFEQGGREMTRLFGGLGLGLAISKALMDAHGGGITAESAGVNRGSTFTIELPAFAGAGVSTAPARPRSDAPAPVGCKILVVEDHVDTARAMARMLAMRGYTVRTADSVAAALSAVGSDAYDVMISDIGLPDGSGLDLMRQVRARRHPLRGIALSGFGMEEDVRRSEDAGFVAHLTKPVNIDRLEAAVRSVAVGAPCAG